MTTEEFFPTRWVLRGVDRSTFATHLEKLRSTNPALARKCLYHAIYLGVLPMSPAKSKTTWKLIECERGCRWCVPNSSPEFKTTQSGNECGFSECKPDHKITVVSTTSIQLEACNWFRRDPNHGD